MRHQFKGRNREIVAEYKVTWKKWILRLRSEEMDMERKWETVSSTGGGMNEGVKPRREVKGTVRSGDG